MIIFYLPALLSYPVYWWLFSPLHGHTSPICILSLCVTFRSAVCQQCWLIPLCWKALVPQKAGESLKDWFPGFPALYLLAPFLLLWQMLLRKLTIIWLNEHNLYFKMKIEFWQKLAALEKCSYLPWVQWFFFQRGSVYDRGWKRENKYVWALAAGHTLQAMHCIIPSSSFFHCLPKCIGLDTYNNTLT